MSNATVVHQPAESRFVAKIGDEVVGRLTYDTHGSTVDLQHTIVDEDQQRQGIGSALVKEALTVVRANKLKARPTCSYVQAYVDEHPEHQDLLEPSLTTEDQSGDEPSTAPGTGTGQA